MSIIIKRAFPIWKFWKFIGYWSIKRRIKLLFIDNELNAKLNKAVDDLSVLGHAEVTWK